MAGEWFELTPTNKKYGDSVYVNLANATSIWAFDKGSRIWFFPDEKFGIIEVTETPAEIAAKIAAMQARQNASRT